jgi:hypothetical protein
VPSPTQKTVAVGIAVLLALLLSVPASAAPQIEEGSDEKVLIPGGEGFIRSVLAMAPRSMDQFGQGFVVEVVNQISQPTALNLPARLGRALDDLEDLRQFLVDLDDRYGETVARFAEPGSDAHRRAEDLLEYFGLRVREVEGVFQHERDDSERSTRRRRLLSQLGISLPVQMQLGSGGQPIEIRIQDTTAAIPFGLSAWREQVFEDNLGSETVLRAFIRDDRARDVLLAYAQMDRPTREILYAAIGLRALHRDASWASGLRRLAPYLRVENGVLALPGGDRTAWEAILGQWSDTADLVRKAATGGGGRAAHLWRALSLIPATRANYLLTLGGKSEEERGRWATRLYLSIKLPELGNPIRWPYDVAELFTNLRMDADGGSLAWPGGARAWLAAFRRPETDLFEPGALDQLLEQLATEPDSGPLADSVLVLTLLVNFDPRGEVSPATRGYLAVSEALRYQPEETIRRAVPLLYRGYERFGCAYGFLALPTPLSAHSVEEFARYLHRVDSIDRAGLLADGTRQHQATLILLHRLLSNDLIPAARRDSLLQRLFETGTEPLLDVAPEEGGGTPAALPTPRATAYGTALLQYLRLELLPAVAEELTRVGWQGDPDDLGAVLSAGLIGQMPRAPVEVQGIPFEYAPSLSQLHALETHLRQQETPPLDLLFQLDALLAEISELPATEMAGTAARGESAARGGRQATDAAIRSAADTDRMKDLADRLEQRLAELEELLPPGVLDESPVGAPPVPIPRWRLFDRGKGLVQQLREGSLHPVAGVSTRRAVTSFLGDSLVGYAYALSMGDPDAVMYQRRHLSWLHQFSPEEIPGGMPRSMFGPWAPTAIGRAGDGGHRLVNSLFGVAGILGHWNLELTLPPELTSVDPLAEEAWGSVVGNVNLIAFDRETLGRVIRHHAHGEQWIRAAVTARDPLLPAPFPTAAGEVPAAAALADSIRHLLTPLELQDLVDAIEEGDEQRALELVSPGNRYLLAHAFDAGELDATSRDRWAQDQVAGMPIGRRGDYVGLGPPPAVPQGEVGDKLRDPRLYNRLLDVRIRLAIEVERMGLPGALAGRLLPHAMARVLSHSPQLLVNRWRGIMDALETELTGEVLRAWILDLAFDDELIVPGGPMPPGRGPQR